jgi:hypothetical protein
MLPLSEAEIVDMPQVFLPFATDAKGQTLYEKMAKGKFLLGDGRDKELYNLELASWDHFQVTQDNAKKG